MQEVKPNSEDGPTETGGFGIATGSWCRRGALRSEVTEGLSKAEVTGRRPRARGGRSELEVYHVASQAESQLRVGNLEGDCEPK
jgi:hypothetical protein